MNYKGENIIMKSLYTIETTIGNGEKDLYFVVAESFSAKERFINIHKDRKRKMFFIRKHSYWQTISHLHELEHCPQENNISAPFVWYQLSINNSLNVTNTQLGPETHGSNMNTHIKQKCNY